MLCGMTETAPTLSIGQVSERTGLSVHALRFYEREGILANPVRRGAGGRRVYGEDDVAWLDLCIILRASGMPLPAIRRYTELVRDGDGNEKDRLVLLREHQARVHGQLDQLMKSLDLINFKVRLYEQIIADGAGPHPCPSPAVDRADTSSAR